MRLEHEMYSGLVLRKVILVDDHPMMVWENNSVYRRLICQNKRNKGWMRTTFNENTFLKDEKF